MQKVKEKKRNFSLYIAQIKIEKLNIEIIKVKKISKPIF